MDCSTPGFPVPLWAGVDCLRAFHRLLLRSLEPLDCLLFSLQSDELPAAPSMGFSGREHFSGCHCLLQGDQANGCSEVLSGSVASGLVRGKAGLGLI